MFSWIFGGSPSESQGQEPAAVDSPDNNINTSNETNIFEYIVIGDGPAGVCSARKAAELGKRVALITNRPNDVDTSIKD